jgi:hypothetical protein
MGEKLTLWTMMASLVLADGHQSRRGVFYLICILRPPSLDGVVAEGQVDFVFCARPHPDLLPRERG